MHQPDPVAAAVDPADLRTGPRAAGLDVRRVTLAYVQLVHPGPTTIVMAATGAFAVLFGRGLPPLPVVAPLLLAMLGGQLAIGALNELVDAELDALAKPWKPIPSGAVTRRGAWLVVALGLTAMVVFGARLGGLALILLALGTGLGLGYDLWMKRTPYSWLPYVLALPLLPIWVRTAILGFDGRLLLLFPLGAGAVAAVHLAQALPDCESDRRAGLRNPVSRLGEPATLRLACILAASAPLFAIVVTTALPGALGNRVLVFVAAMVGLGLIGATMALYRRRRSLGLRAAFPCLATATVVVALGWIIGAS
jgi:4-hydroxybenzoate polyprenyltransferase